MLSQNAHVSCDFLFAIVVQCTRTSGAGGGGASVPPIVLICRKSVQIPENLGKNPGKTAPNVCRKTHEDLFWG